MVLPMVFSRLGIQRQPDHACGYLALTCFNKDRIGVQFGLPKIIVVRSRPGISPVFDLPKKRHLTEQSSAETNENWFTCMATGNWILQKEVIQDDPSTW